MGWLKSKLADRYTYCTRQEARLSIILFHCIKKAEYSLKEDPPTALLVMHMDLMSLLLSHYKQYQKWWVGPHRVLADLSTWDLKLAQLVGRFLAAGEVYAKFQVWSEIEALDDVHTHGFITNRMYRQLTGVSDRTAHRDLEMLVGRGRLKGTGQRSARRYVLA